MALKNHPCKLFTDKFGRQFWQLDSSYSESDFHSWLSTFSFDKSTNANSTDAVYRSQCVKLVPPGTQPSSALERGWQYFSQLQAQEGHWPGDYGGPMFLLPGLIFASHITQSPFTPAEHSLMKRYMLNHQNADGGWGLHIQGGSTMFGTVLQYVALRLLGESAHQPQMIKARDWIIKNGGAIQVPSWGKFYLSVLGLYEWEGCNSLLPEMWLLPQWMPMHPSHYWCHTRMVYLPMAYCYSHRIVGHITPLISELRSEIHVEKYEHIDWVNARNNCVKSDLYHPQSTMLKWLNKAINLYEQSPVKSWRKIAQDYMLSYINAEDEQTNYINIGPVNQAINSICIWHAYGKESQSFKKHRDRWSDYLWIAEDGMKMQGYNGSQLWDTAFAFQALHESNVKEKFNATLQNALAFIDRTQVREEGKDHKLFFRHNSVGGWPFSTSPHGWPITDCTAEGLKIMLGAVKEHGFSKQEMQDLLFSSCDLLLSFQNKDGGWASYELTRGYRWLEWLNPSEIFGNIMIDYSYTECTSASLQALMKFRLVYPSYRTAEILNTIHRGIDFILRQQRTDGSWYGSWAVCFTYGTWFACEVLSDYLKQNYAQRDIVVRSALQKAFSFLRSKQQDDGGWGESYESSVAKKYVPTERSQAVNTAWALLSLMSVIPHIHADDLKYSIQKGIQFLEKEQLPNGDFKQEHINGVFNHNCMISYTNYRNIFPLWALGRYYSDQSLSTKS